MRRQPPLLGHLPTAPRTVRLASLGLTAALSLIVAQTACAPAWHYRSALNDPHDHDDFERVPIARRGESIAVAEIRNETDGMSDAPAFAEALRVSGVYTSAPLVTVPTPGEPTLSGSTTRRCSVNFSRGRRGAVTGFLVLAGVSAAAWIAGAIQTQGFRDDLGGTGWQIGLGIGTGVLLTGSGLGTLIALGSSTAAPFVDCDVTADLRVTRAGVVAWSHRYRDRVRLHPSEDDLGDARLSQVFLRIASWFGRDYGGVR